MQRRIPLRRGVWIGATIEEPGRQLVVRVGRRQQERVEAHLRCSGRLAVWPAVCGAPPEDHVACSDSLSRRRPRAAR